MRVIGQRLNAHPPAIIRYIFPPFRRQVPDDTHGLVVAVQVLAHAEIGVEGGYHALRVRRINVSVVLLCLGNASSYDAPVDVYPIHLDVRPYPFHAFRVVLAIELALVEFCTQDE